MEKSSPDGIEVIGFFILNSSFYLIFCLIFNLLAEIKSSLFKNTLTAELLSDRMNVLPGNTLII